MYKKWSNLNLINLNKYYNGTCGARPGSSRLCSKGYNRNKNINFIENAISRNCNLNCKMCTFKNTYNKRELDLYNKLNDILYNKNYNTIMLTTNGEPFFDKKSTMEFIKKTNAKEIIIISNGQLLDHNDLDILKKSKNVKLIFSIDSINKNLYEKIRVNASFERIIDNIIYSKNIGLLDHINYTVQEDNLSELNDSLKYFDLLDIPVDLCIDSKTVNINQVDEYINNINRYLKNDESI